MELKNLFNKPCIVGVIGMPNSAKSNTLYFIIEELKKIGKFNLYTFGLRSEVEGNKINSVKELEQIKNSLIILDEFNTLFDLDNRKHKKQIEQTLRLIFHNNNILILCSVPEAFKKFICGKVDIFIFKKLYYDDLINGSKAKKIIMDYHDITNIKGSEVLNLELSQGLVYDGNYSLINIPYIKRFDTKKDNQKIIK
jgi:hypothetical protein